MYKKYYKKKGLNIRDGPSRGPGPPLAQKIIKKFSYIYYFKLANPYRALQAQPNFFFLKPINTFNPTNQFK